MADAGPAGDFRERELPALVLAQHVHRGVDDGAAQIAVMIGFSVVSCMVFRCQ